MVYLVILAHWHCVTDRYLLRRPSLHVSDIILILTVILSYLKPIPTESMSGIVHKMTGIGLVILFSAVCINNFENK